MSEQRQTAIPIAAEEIDDPYIYTVSTEEFVEAVEQASQETKENVLTPNQD